MRAIGYNYLKGAKAMLKFFRKKHVMKFIFWSLLILILPAFVLWGTGNLGGSKDKGPKFVGMVNNRRVSFDDLAQSLTSIRCQIILNYFNQPEVLKAFSKNQPFLAKLAWDRIIMASEARKQRIRIPDKDVINQIKSHPIFMRNGKFDDKVYDYILRHNIGMAPRAFEEVVRQNMAIQKMNDILTKDVEANDADILEEYLKDNGRFKIAYLLTPLSDFTDQKVNLDEEKIRDYYDKHRAEIMVKPAIAEDKTPPRAATFEEARERIRATLIEAEAFSMALKSSEELRKKVIELMDKEKLSFEEASSRLRLKAEKTDFFSKTDKLERIGESPMLGDAASRLKAGEVSEPVYAEKGVMIFTVTETEKVDDEAFKKARDDYAKKSLEKKKNKFLETWLRDLEKKASLNIDLNNYEKYYQ